MPEGSDRLTKGFKEILMGSSNRDKEFKQSMLTSPFPIPRKDIQLNEKGIPMVTFSHSEMEMYAQDLWYTLVGKFSYGYPALQTIKKEFYKLNLTGNYFVGILNVRHIIIKLSNETDYLTVWGKGILWMDIFPMRILKWTIDFNLRLNLRLF